MTLIQNGLHKVQDGVGTLELRAEADTSLRVTRIRECGPCDATRYVELTIDRKSVGYFRCAYPDVDMHSASDIAMNEVLSQYVPGGQIRHLCINIFDWMREYGVPITYPVAEGQTFRVTIIAGTQIDVEYDLFEAGDVAATELNGTESNEFLYIERGSNPAAIVAGTTQYEIVDSITPATFPDFPFEGIAGAKSTFEIYGIIGQPSMERVVAPGLGWCTDRLQLIHDREIMLDPDRVGIQFLGNAAYAVVGRSNYRINSVVGHNANPLDRPLMFNPPLKFEPGAELNTIVTFTGAAAAACLEVNALDVGYILKETRA